MATDTELVEGEVVDVQYGDLSIVESLERAQVDIQITTAKRYPRSLATFKKQATEFATLDEETASSMFYVLPRGGKKIEGPSVRLAEVVGSCWGNCRFGARIVATDDKFVTAQGMCFDLEKNISAAVEVKRRITNKNGVRFNDDMIQTTSNAACSIALRQAIFKVIPFALVKGIYDQARLTSLGKSDSMADRRAKMLGWFLKVGVSEKQVLATIERNGPEEITIDDLITLKGLATAIKDGETTIEEAFETPQAAHGKKVATSDLTDTIGKGTPPKSTETKVTTQSTASTEDPVTRMRREYAEAKTDGDALNVYDAQCGPEAWLTDPAHRDESLKLYQARKAELAGGTAGDMKSEVKGELFSKAKSATEGGM